MQHPEHLEALFAPESVAVIGASPHPGKIGHIILHNLISAGYQGKIYPVNPKATEILGIPVVNAIAELPGPLDLGVISVPPQLVLEALNALATLPVKAVIIITAGFKEIGREGYQLEQDVVRLCSERNIALLGPNCLGMINTKGGVNASFAKGAPAPGNIAFFSQSGALCVAILDWALGNGVGFSKFVSLGNKALLDESDMLAYLVDDPDTSVILGYIEGVDNGDLFMQTARTVTRRKPVVMIKSGTTAAGAKAASSHTGAIAGSDSAYSAAFKQTGIIRATDVGTLFDLALAFAHQPLPKGPNLAIVTNSGGPGIMAADACERSGLLLARLGQNTVEQLQQALPPYASLYNPIDVIGDAPPERYAKALEIVLKDEAVHSVLVLLSPTASADAEATARAAIDISKDCGKPVFGCFMGGPSVAVGARMLQDAGIPCYSFPEPAISSLDAMFKYAAWKDSPPPVALSTLRNLEQARAIIQQARDTGHNEVVEFQAQGLLRAYNLPVPEGRLARTSDEAVAVADSLGYPVVIKIASPDISHKSDVSGVKVNLKNAAEVKAAFLDVTSRAQRMRKGAYILGCLVQQMAPPGSKEVIVGVKRDPQFGPLILFGLGGVYVEVLKDVSFRLAPLTLDDAQDMIREIRTYPLLRGVRGEPSIDFKALEDVLLTMSQIAMDFPEILEAEFNPVLVGPHGALVADVRMLLDQAP